MSAPDVPDVPVHSREYNDLVSALAREERPEAERRPLSRAQGTCNQGWLAFGLKSQLTSCVLSAFHCTKHLFN